jgi:predicted MFS family arabinose efflux permease
VQGTGAYLSHHHGTNAPSTIAELHAMAAGVGLFAPVLVGVGVTVGFGWRPALFVSALGILVVEVVRGRDVYQYGPPMSVVEDSNHHDALGPLPRRFWFAWAAILCTAATEFSLLLWASDLLRVQGGLTKGASAASLGCVVGGMFVGRLATARLSTRIDAEKLYRGSLLLALIGFLVFWSSYTPLLMLIALFVTGLGVGGHFPLGLARSMRASEGRPDRGSARMSIGAGLASGVAPFALGAMADHIGIHNAYAIVPISLVIALAIATKVRVPVS